MRLLLILSLVVFPVLRCWAAERPNVLWLSCEDISPHLGCFGDQHAITPNLDAFAKEAVRYPNTFTTAGVCAPCRSGIITGMYQTTLGTHHMRCRATLPAHVRPFPAYLREVGYFCSNNAKEDYQFNTSKDVWDVSSKRAHWRDNPDRDKPFFSVFNFGGCHESGIVGDAKYQDVTKNLKASQRQDPSKLVLPPYYPDTPVVREDWKRNYELITAMDAWAGDLIQQLKDDGLYENTIIFYWSDHGVGLPRAKRWLYDSGTRVPLMVRVPGSTKPNTIDTQLVSSIDFAPTVLSLVGLDVPKHFQGRAFLGTDLTDQRQYVYGARDRMDERYDIIRAVRDKRYRYIRNYEPNKAYYQYMNTPEKGATMKELRRVAQEGALPEAAALFMAERKPTEELYDLEKDPHEVNNLVEASEMKETLARMREVHLKWVAETRDMGLLPEAEIERREQALESRHAIFNGSGGLTLMQRMRDTANFTDSGALAKALSDEDAGVRYWAATGLGNGRVQDPSILDKLTNCLEDKTEAVRVAAARALCHAGEPEEALPVLAEVLEGGAQWARLQAAIVFDEIGDLAYPYIPLLQRCLSNQPNKYITRVANRALNDLLGTAYTTK